MDTLQRLELDLIATLQTIVVLAEPMRWLSYLGWEGFWIVLPCVSLVFDRRAGAPLFLLYYLNILLINVAKLAFHSPRPFWVDERIQALAGSGSFGMPSGHVQLAVVVWFFLALHLKRAAAWVLAAVAVLGVSISRVYLGVHFVSDVVGAWILGGLALAAFQRTEPVVSDRLRGRSFGFHIGIAMAFPFWLFVIGLLMQQMLLPAVDSSHWTRFAGSAHSSGWLWGASGGAGWRC